ncbi:MAG: Mov34/MPN/PAD-1 family protein [Acidobacteriota bacterium]
MIEITPEAWAVMVQHAQACYPNECCGILIGSESPGRRQASLAVACRNAYSGSQSDRFEIDPKDQLAAERQARQLSLGVLGFFHSHPDEAAYFSQTDLKNHWPFYSNVVLSVRHHQVVDAKCVQVDVDQTASTEEELLWPKS